MKLTKIFEKAKPFTNVFGHKDYNLQMNEDDFHRVKEIVDDYHKLEEMKSELARIELELERKRDLLKSADEVQTMIDRCVEAAKNTYSLQIRNLSNSVERLERENNILREHFENIPITRSRTAGDLLRFLKNSKLKDKKSTFNEIMKGLILNESLCKETKQIFDDFRYGQANCNSYDREISKRHSGYNRDER